MKLFIITEQGALPSVPEFTSKLIARWLGAKVELISNPERRYALEFQAPMAHSRLEGMLHRTGGSITFEGDLRDCSEFVQWCRSLVPSHLPLTFCDEGMNGEVSVTPSMTPTEISQAFRESGG